MGRTSLYPQSASPECYNSANVDNVGDAPGCEGMLIVSDSALRSVASKNADPDGGYKGGGVHGEFEILHAGTTYTFADSEANIFTGQVKDMSFLFRDTDFNGDIGYWETSSVTTMRNMFDSNSRFNQDIGNWNVSKVTIMRQMFSLASQFDQDIGS